jgi:hypothetical protein
VTASSTARREGTRHHFVAAYRLKDLSLWAGELPSFGLGMEGLRPGRKRHLPLTERASLREVPSAVSRRGSHDDPKPHRWTVTTTFASLVCSCCSPPDVHGSSEGI